MIGANNCDPNQRLGAHSAQFRLYAGGALDGSFYFPLAGLRVCQNQDVDGL